MAVSAGTAYIRVDADLSAFNRQIREKLSGRLTEQVHVEVNENTLRQNEQKVQAHASRIGGIVKGALAAVGTVGAVEYLKSATDGVNQLFESSMKLHAIAGLSRTDAIQWTAVTQAMGINSQKLTVAFKTLDTQFTQAQAGSTKSIQAFKDLGISQDDLNKTGGDSAKIFDLVNEHLAKMPPSARKTADEFKLLGRGTAALNPLLADGGEEFRKLQKFADSLGITLNQNTTKNIEAARDAQFKFKIAMEAAQLFVVNKLIPAFLDVGKWLSKNVVPPLKAAGGAVADFVKHNPELAKIAATAAVLGAAFSKLGVISAVTGGISGLARVLPLLANPIGATVAGIAALGVGFVVAYNKIKPFHDWVDRTWKKFYTDHAKDFQAIGHAVTVMANAFATVALPIIKRAWGAIEEIFSGAIRAIGGVIKIIGGLLTLNFGRVWSGVKDIFSGGIKAVLGEFKLMTAPIREIAVRIWHGIATAASAAWGAVRSAVVDLFRKVVGEIKSWADDVLGIAKFVFHKIADGVSAVWGWVSDAVNWVIGKAVALVKSYVDAYFNAGKFLINAVAGGFKAVAGDVWDAIKWILGQAKKTVEGFFGDFFDVGKFLIHGILEGIKNAANDLKDGAVNVVKSAWHGVKDFFGIGSPSKLMHDVGVQVMQGLAGGLDQPAMISKSLSTALTGPFDTAEKKMASTVTKMAADVRKSFTQMVKDIQWSTQTSQTSLGNFATTIQNATRSAALNSTEAGGWIAKGLNAVLAAFKAPKVATPSLPTSGSWSNWWKGKAQGGLIQIGQPGARGEDAIPLSVGGTPIVVGDGEQVMILNAQQQAAMNARWGDVGGLPGFFNRFDKPHYMARGGPVPRYATGGWTTVRASQESLGGDGYKGNPIQAYGYSELSIPPSVANAGSALGHLPYLTHMRIKAGAKEVVAAKQDIGAGSSFNPAMGLYPGTSAQLGLSGGAYTVQIQRADGVPLTIGGLAAAEVIPLMKKLKVKGGMGQTLGALMQVAADKEIDAANKYIGAHQPAPTGGGGLGGTAPPLNGPAAVQAMIRKASWIDAQHYPYVLGGGHGSFNGGPYDCSGAVSAVLHAGGYLSSPEVTGGLKSFGVAGSGSHITVYVENSSAAGGHTIMSIDGHLFGTSGSHGGNWLAGSNPVAYSPIGHWEDIRHPFGLARGGFVGRHKLDPRAYARAIKPATKHEIIRNWDNDFVSQPGLARGGFVPGFATGGPVKGFAKGGAVKHVPHIKPPKAVTLPRLQNLPNFEIKIGGRTVSLGTLDTIDATTQDWTSWQGFIEGLHSGVGTATPTVDVGDPPVTTVNWGSKAGLPPISRSDLTGLVDPASPAAGPTMGIWDRVRQITLGPPIGAGEFPTKLGDPHDTELGIDQALLGQYGTEQGYANALLSYLGSTKPREGWLGKLQYVIDIAKENVLYLQRGLDDTFAYDRLDANFTGFPPVVIGWTKKKTQITEAAGKLIRAKVTELKNLLARIEYLKARHDAAVPTKKARLEAIATKYLKERNAMRNKAATEKVSGSGVLSNLVHEIQAERTAALAKVKKPAGWKGTNAAWLAQAAADRTAINATFDDQQSRLNSSTAAKTLQGTIARNNAMTALTIAEAAERAAVDDFFAGEDRDIQTQIGNATVVRTADAKVLNDYLSEINSEQSTAQGDIDTALGSGDPTASYAAKLHQFVDPGKALDINVKTLQLETIPGLQNEVQLLAGTVLPKQAAADTTAADTTGGVDTTGADATTAADNSALLSLLQQKLAEAGQALAVSQAQYAVLAVPSFQYGGRVPGPPGAPQIIVAHGGEEYLGAGASARQPVHVTVVVQDGAVDRNKIQVIATDVVNNVTRSNVRAASRGLPSRGGGLIGV